MNIDKKQQHICNTFNLFFFRIFINSCKYVTNAALAYVIKLPLRHNIFPQNFNWINQRVKHENKNSMTESTLYPAQKLQSANQLKSSLNSTSYLTSLNEIFLCSCCFILIIFSLSYFCCLIYLLPCILLQIIIRFAVVFYCLFMKRIVKQTY